MGGQRPPFVQTGLRFAKREFRSPVCRVTVAAFNERALAVDEKAGFRRIERFRLKPNEAEFVILLLQSNSRYSNHESC